MGRHGGTLSHMPVIRPAECPRDLDAVVGIFREYIASPTVDLGFQDYERELARLPGAYAPPGGCLLLAWQGAAVVGCAALRRVDTVTAEMKRVYLRPVARGTGLGRRLVLAVLTEARRLGFRRVCLDVLPEFTAAQRLYRSLGFVPAAPVSFNPVPGTLFLALALDHGADPTDPRAPMGRVSESPGSAAPAGPAGG
jgi:putative acetyltransferase